MHVASAQQTEDQVPWFLQSSVPVLLPALEALTYPRNEFEAYIRKDLTSRHGNDVTMSDDGGSAQPERAVTEATSESFTLITPSTTTAGDLATGMDNMQVDAPTANKEESQDKVKMTGQPFMDALLGNEGQDQNHKGKTPSLENKMLTDNGDVANISTTNPLVDLFAELEDVVKPPRLNDLLNAAWAHDALATLKIIFNARSIHLGKSSRQTFYRCAGWLAANHPRTLVANLPWLSRPVIPKKERKDDEQDPDLVVVEAEGDTDDNDEKGEDNVKRFDIKHGVSHGYWKDLLNMLVLAANDQLHVLAHPSDVLNPHQGVRPTSHRPRKGRPYRAQKISRRAPTLVASRPEVSTKLMTESQRRAKDKIASELAKKERCTTRSERQERITRKLRDDPVYRALHLTIARLFAQQLQIDTERLKSNDGRLQGDISLCAKWAPSHDRFHDRHTLITTSIAEILFPASALDLDKHHHHQDKNNSREFYLRHAREAYRKATSALRKHLDIVERNISAKSYGAIHYDRVPSQAMRQYTSLFIEHDHDRFAAYLDKVSSGGATISGATLLPSVMVQSVLSSSSRERDLSARTLAKLPPAQRVAHVRARMQAQVVDGQWQTLVRRIRDSGTLSSSIAVCDVSGSMIGPQLADGTTPLHSSIGLSLLVASVTEPPFGGAFISFHESPTVQRVDLDSTFSAQVARISSAPWGANTNFEAVFSKCILPLARENNVKPEDMVKRVFVFSDMQFDRAQGREAQKAWTSSFERIKRQYGMYGYDVPEMIFWNLAGGAGGVAPKPVTMTDCGTAVVSGYSQGLLKVFLDSGGFDNKEEEEEEEEEAVAAEGENGVEEEKTTARKQKGSKAIDPLKTVKKAIGHPAYAMLRVVD